MYFDDMKPSVILEMVEKDRSTVGTPMISINSMYGNYQTMSFDIYTKGHNNGNVDHSWVMMEGM